MIRLFRRLWPARLGDGAAAAVPAPGAETETIRYVLASAGDIPSRLRLSRLASVVYSPFRSVLLPNVLRGSKWRRKTLASTIHGPP